MKSIRVLLVVFLFAFGIIGCSGGGGGSDSSQVKTPVISPDSGTYDAGTEISITSDTDGATIYYTTDGSDPTTESNIFTDSFELDGDMTIKAMAVKEEMDNSDIASVSLIVEYVYEDERMEVYTAFADSVVTTDDIQTLFFKVTENKVVFTSDVSLAEGDIFIVENEAFKVTSVDSSGGDFEVSVETPEIGEVFDTLEIDTVVNVTTEHVDTSSVKGVNIRRGEEGEDSDKINYEVNYEVVSGIFLKGNVSLDKPQVKFAYNFGLLEEKYIDFSFYAKEEFNLSLESEEYEFSKSISIPLGKIIVPVPITLGTVAANMDVYLEFDANGKAQVYTKIEQSSTLDMGIKASMNDLSNPQIKRPSAQKLLSFELEKPTFKGSIEVGASVNFDLDIKVLTYDTLGMESELGIGSSAELAGNLDGEYKVEIKGFPEFDSSIYIMAPSVSYEGGFSWEKFKESKVFSMKKHSYSIFHYGADDKLFYDFSLFSAPILESIVSSTDGSGDYTVTWQKPSFYEADGYKIYYRPYGETEYTLINTIENFDTDSTILNNNDKDIEYGYIKITTYEKDKEESEYSNTVKVPLSEKPITTEHFGLSYHSFQYLGEDFSVKNNGYFSGPTLYMYEENSPASLYNPNPYNNVSVSFSPTQVGVAEAYLNVTVEYPDKMWSHGGRTYQITDTYYAARYIPTINDNGDFGDTVTIESDHGVSSASFNFSSEIFSQSMWGAISNHQTMLIDAYFVFKLSWDSGTETGVDTVSWQVFHGRM